MKKHLSLLSVLTFVCTLLYGFSSVWARSEILDVLNAISEGAKKEELERQEQKEKEELKKRNQEKQEKFDKKVNEIIKKLPVSARVAVPDIKIQFPKEMDIPEEALKSVSEDMRLSFENMLEEAGVKIVERDAFKEIEKEIVYSQTGEIDSASSAKFGKAVGATHMFLAKVSFSGPDTEHQIITISLRVVEVESMLRVGTAIGDMELPKTKKSSSPPTPQTLVSETFYVNPRNSKDYSLHFKSDGILAVNMSANSDVNLYMVDMDNYAKFMANRSFRGFVIKEKITSANFSVTLMKGDYFIIVSNYHSLFTTAGVSLGVVYTPKD